MRVAVFGAAGHIGRHIGPRLRAAGAQHVLSVELDSRVQTIAANSLSDGHADCRPVAIDPESGARMLSRGGDQTALQCSVQTLRQWLDEEAVSHVVDVTHVGGDHMHVQGAAAQFTRDLMEAAHSKDIPALACSSVVALANRACWPTEEERTNDPYGYFKSRMLDLDSYPGVTVGIPDAVLGTDVQYDLRLMDFLGAAMYRQPLLLGGYRLMPPCYRTQVRPVRETDVALGIVKLILAQEHTEARLVNMRSSGLSLLDCFHVVGDAMGLAPDSAIMTTEKDPEVYLRFADCIGMRGELSTWMQLQNRMDEGVDDPTEMEFAEFEALISDNDEGGATSTRDVLQEMTLARLNTPQHPQFFEFGLRVLKKNFPAGILPLVGAGLHLAVSLSTVPRAPAQG